MERYKEPGESPSHSVRLNLKEKDWDDFIAWGKRYLGSSAKVGSRMATLIITDFLRKHPDPVDGQLPQFDTSPPSQSELF